MLALNGVTLLQNSLQMTEQVGSYLELYTTLFGAKAGEDFFTLFWAIGFYKIGFVMVAVFTLIDAFKKGGAEGGWYFIRTIAVRMLALFVVMLIFVWPSMKLDMRNIEYDPPSTFATAAEGGGDPVTIYDATTTYGQSGFKPDQYDVKVSIAQRLAMAFGHGINRATTKLLASQTSMRLLDEGLSTMKIEDPALKQELVEFNQECYIPAINKWKTFWRERGKPVELKNLETLWKQTDLTYIGSRVLMETPGLYAMPESEPLWFLPAKLASGRWLPLVKCTRRRPDGLSRHAAQRHAVLQRMVEQRQRQTLGQTGGYAR